MVAGITVFRPERSLLSALLQRLAEDGLHVLVYVDGPTGVAIDSDFLPEIRARRGATVIQARTNTGIGAGLNALADAARTGGYRQILLFDQDSAPPAGLPAHLGTALATLQAAGARPAVVGPRPVNPPGEMLKPPRYSTRPGMAESGGCRPVDYVITSGSLICLDAIAAVGSFRSDYVIDAIDTEWCFRAWHKGWSVWTADHLAMPHRVGRGVIRLGPLRFPRQDEARMATYLRNQSHGLRLGHVPMRWKIRFLAYAPLQAVVYTLMAPARRRTALRLCRAVSDGLRGRLGPLN